jgi:protein MpaA
MIVFTRTERSSIPSSVERNGGQRDSSGRTASLLAEMDRVAAGSDFVRRARLASIDSYIFEGPHGGGEPIRIGCFAGIHGDEPAGSLALLKLIETLVRDPAIAEGYNVFFYPICNPHGFDAGSRFSHSGKDLNREFWRRSSEAEVVILENEIQKHSFHGLISLHSDDTSDGLYGFVRGAVLARSLLMPALEAAERLLPRNRNQIIDGFAAEDGIISQCYDGILTSPPKLENTPFEVILETPQNAPVEKQVDGFVAALLSILTEYRTFIAFAADL